VFDFFRQFPNFEFLTYEAVQQNIIDMFEDEERFRKENIFTIKDLGIENEDYYYWESQLLEPFHDKENVETVHWRGKQNGTYGGSPPSTQFISAHSVALYGYRPRRPGQHNRDWFLSEDGEYEFDTWDPEYQTKYGSNIDGKNELPKYVEH